MKKPFSSVVFSVTIIATLLVFFVSVRIITPDLYERNLDSPLWKWIVVFLTSHLVYAFAEFFFHRYVLHRPFPYFTSLHKQHTLHHGLTRVKLLSIPNQMGDTGKVFNRYPIVEDKQHEASYFPWFSLGAFTAVFLPFVIIGQYVFPTFPITFCAVLALAWSLSLYEIVHMIEHLSFEKFWLKKICHERFGRIWEKLYCFHLRHHANILLNENISGFFTIPVADFVFRTYAPWSRAYLEGEMVSSQEFEAFTPRPCALIRYLDTLASRS